MAIGSMSSDFIIWLGMFLSHYQTDMKSLDFTVTRFLMKLFKSSNINLINDSRYYFNFELPSELQTKRKDKCIEKFMAIVRGFWIILPFSNCIVIIALFN